MRILVVGTGPWNDVQMGNNVMTNFFTGLDATFANIDTHYSTPCNNLCESYYCLTDDMMIRSFFGKKAGEKLYIPFAKQKELQEQSGLYMSNASSISRAKKLPLNIGLALKDIVWRYGKIDEESLKSFISDFDPDIVFCHHVFSMQAWRIERLVRKFTDAPMVAFTGDGEVSLKQFSLSPLFWIRRISLNIIFRKHIKQFSHYWTFCEEQAKWYQSFSGVPSSTLYKCADMPETFTPKTVGNPIRLVYAGNILYKRWETLAKIANALSFINWESTRMTLDIYTNTPLTESMSKALKNKKGTMVHGRVSPEELVEIYKQSDIALHIESFSLRDRLGTKDSFSTKIVDLMNSTCAMMAICWEGHNGYQYLKKEDAAICICEPDKISIELQKICEHPEIIQEYAKKAWECGCRNHTREVLKNQLCSVFEKLIEK